MSKMRDYDAAQSKAGAKRFKRKDGRGQKGSDFVGEWQTANLFESLANHSLYFGSSSATWIGEHSDNGAVLKRLTDTTDAKYNPYNDDAAWWALAWIRQSQGLPKANPLGLRYLHNAQAVFARLVKSWGTTRCGGLTWTSHRVGARPKPYVNSITNELFLMLAARLANVNGQSLDTHVATGKLPAPNDYAGWARLSARWWLVGEGSALIKPAANGIRDGLEPSESCAIVGAEYSYNQGVILGGLADYAALAARSNIDDVAALEAVARLVGQLGGSSFVSGSSNVIIEPHARRGARPGNSDHASFKGVLARYLGYSYAPMIANADRVAGAGHAAAAIRTIIDASSSAAIANSIKTRPHGKGGTATTFGYDWSSSKKNSKVYYQAVLAGSALDLLNAAHLISVLPNRISSE